MIGRRKIGSVVSQEVSKSVSQSEKSSLYIVYAARYIFLRDARFARATPKTGRRSRGSHDKNRVCKGM